jgi:hypothetical protein
MLHFYTFYPVKSYIHIYIYSFIILSTYTKEHKLQHMYGYHCATYCNLHIGCKRLPDDDCVMQSKHVGGCVNKAQ